MTASTPTPTPSDVLWQRLERWNPQAEGLACGFARSLTHRLCQRHGWHAEYALRAVEEYRRFMWLLVHHRGALCPSEAVDAVWHEHLLDSQTYFEHFCPQVLGQTLHHVPARGGEGDLHRARYSTTLQAYAHAFGHAPPVDLWPAPHKRWAARRGLPGAATLGRAIRSVLSCAAPSVSPSAAPWHAWRAARHSPAQPPVAASCRDFSCSPGAAGAEAGAAEAGAKPTCLPAPAASTARASLAAGVALAFALAAAGCAQLVGLDPQTRVSGPVFLLGYTLALGLLIHWAWRLHTGFRPSRRAPVQAVDLPVLDLAFIAGGPWRVALASAAGLWQAGHVQWQPAPDETGNTAGRWVTGDVPLPAQAGEIDRTVHRALVRGDDPYLTVMALKLPLAQMQQRLWQQGLLHTPRRKAWFHDKQAALLAGLLVALWGLGVVRFFTGLAMGRPVAFLMFALVFMAVLMPFMWLGAWRPTRLTTQGRLSRDLARQRFDAALLAQPHDARMPSAVALYGATALAGAALPLSLVFVPPVAKATQGSGSGCGATSASSGCSGGGGCGGCGG